MSSARSFASNGVVGYLHEPSHPVGALALTHGAGSNCHSLLLVRLAEEFTANGWIVFRYDLAFRQARPHGSPFPAQSAADREGIRSAALEIKKLCGGPRVLGGHSYGGRQSSMLAASDPSVANALLLLSYPLHPPRKPEDLRTAHFPQLQTSTLFVHGTRDPFGSLDELQSAAQLIPARKEFLFVEKAGHDLKQADASGIRRALVSLLDLE